MRSYDDGMKTGTDCARSLGENRAIAGNGEGRGKGGPDDNVLVIAFEIGGRYCRADYRHFAQVIAGKILDGLGIPALLDSLREEEGCPLDVSGCVRLMVYGRILERRSGLDNGALYRPVASPEDCRLHLLDVLEFVYRHRRPLAARLRERVRENFGDRTDFILRSTSERYTDTEAPSRAPFASAEPSGEWTTRHTAAYSWICRLAVSVLRIIRIRISERCPAGEDGRRPALTIVRIREAMRGLKVSALSDEFYRFSGVDDEDMGLVLEAMGLRIEKKLFRMEELVSLEGSVRF